MTIPVSTVPAATAAILAATEALAATDPTQVQVFWGDPVALNQDDVIQIGMMIRRDPNPERLVGSGGGAWMDEKYDVICICSSFTGADDVPAVTNRAWELVAYLETAVRQDPSLGGAVILAYPSLTEGGDAEWVDATETSGGGRKCDITVTITCTATI